VDDIQLKILSLVRSLLVMHIYFINLYDVKITFSFTQNNMSAKLPLSKRINFHRSAWSKFNKSHVAEHFHLEEHSLKDVSLYCIEHNTQWSDVTRKSRESYWIRRLNTLDLQGINKGDYL
jgi:hypothetical protein